MTPKEKSKELIERFEDSIYENFAYTGDGVEVVLLSKKCALIAVDEIIELHKGKFMCERENQNESYWQEVKEEIEKL